MAVRPRQLRRGRRPTAEERKLKNIAIKRRTKSNRVGKRGEGVGVKIVGGGLLEYRIGFGDRQFGRDVDVLAVRVLFVRRNRR